MITLFLRAELLIELGVSTLLAWLLWQSGQIMLALYLPVGLFVVLRIAAVLVAMVLLWFLRDRFAPPLSVAGRVRLIWQETLALFRVYLLMLSEPGTTRLPRPTILQTRTIVVLLHGVYCNRGIWRPWLPLLAAQTGCAVMMPNLEPVMASLETQARQFAHWLDSMINSHGRQGVILVGYSMGGLIARICMEQALLTTAVRKLICIGTPHAGSRVANLAIGKVGHDLRIGSVALSSLRKPEEGERMQIVNLYSRHDTFIVPCQNACLPGAVNETFDGIGHLSLLYSPDIQAAVLRELHTS